MENAAKKHASPMAKIMILSIHNAMQKYAIKKIAMLTSNTSFDLPFFSLITEVGPRAIIPANIAGT